MGKIHRALEKSRKDRQRKKSDLFNKSGSNSLGKKGSNDSYLYKSGNQNIDESEKSKLGTIHVLLDDEAKINNIDKNKDSATKVGKDSNKLEVKKINTLQEPSDETINNNLDDIEYDNAKINTYPKKIEINDSSIDQTQWAGEEDEPKSQQHDTIISNTGGFENIHHSLVTVLKPRSFEAEQFKILRTNLLFPETGRLPKTILVTSAVPGEGKTFTAINLAVTLAQNINSTVLLVDADIRKPEVHQRFGFNDNLDGLSEFLSESKPIPSLLVKTQIENLTILPGGKAVANPSELISSDKMKKLLDELATRYSDRFIIIDAPPPKMAAETFALARFVERIIPVIRSGRSNRELVYEMLNLLERDKVQGVVLNCYDIRDNKRFGYHKYSEYYSK